MTATQVVVSPATPPGPFHLADEHPNVLDVLEDWHNRIHGAGRMEHCSQEPCVDVRGADTEPRGTCCNCGCAACADCIGGY